MPEDISERISDEIWKIERDEGVTVLLAVESGSRAWGFASQDSDYDVRFVYKRPIYDYLRLDKRKDTIEWCQTDELDIVGWDVSKYLSLLHRSNPSALEWLECPRYLVGDSIKLRRVQTLAEGCLDARSLAFHYVGMARENANEFLRIANGEVRDEAPQTKKYVYVVRALLSARYVTDYGEMPPIRLDDLIDCYRDRLVGWNVMGPIERLIERKRDGLEADVHERIPELDDWAMLNLDLMRLRAAGMEAVAKPTWDDVNETFISIVTT